jgi:hypothetical protein
MLTSEQRIEIIRQAHAKVLEEKGTFLTEGLLPTTQEDVLDEAEHLIALDHEEKVDFDNDENEVDMENVSPAMREAFA